MAGEKSNYEGDRRFYEKEGPVNQARSQPYQQRPQGDAPQRDFGRRSVSPPVGYSARRSEVMIRGNQASTPGVRASEIPRRDLVRYRDDYDVNKQRYPGGRLAPED